ncbi:hypothetical protein CRE_28805 [Caenorhabditis remanei]|uniref:Uncharacterized protein n=1 Tax=Caenorhabditis remanei TaxID=31234 RepID=E3MK65_CAERE|nr:hypothetical protein CRE_28805 [Caenorhabditis remanei]
MCSFFPTNKTELFEVFYQSSCKMNFCSPSYFLVFFLIIHGLKDTVSFPKNSQHPSFFNFQNAYVTKNITVDRAVDQMLLKIESAVRHRNTTEFESFFSPKFDSESWFDRYYSELSESQLQTFVFQLRRFGHVDARGKDYKFKFSESHNVTEKLLLRSFIAWTKGTPTNQFAIQTIRYYGEY